MGRVVVYLRGLRPKRGTPEHNIFNGAARVHALDGRSHVYPLTCSTMTSTY